MKLTINDELVSITRIGKTSNGFTEVFVNDNSSCHQLPSHIVSKDSTYKSISFRVCSNNYKVER